MGGKQQTYKHHQRQQGGNIDVAKFLAFDQTWGRLLGQRSGIAGADPAEEQRRKRPRSPPNLSRGALPAILQEIDNNHQQGDLQQSGDPTTDQEPNEREGNTEKRRYHPPKPRKNIHWGSLCIVATTGVAAGLRQTSEAGALSCSGSSRCRSHSSARRRPECPPRPRRSKSRRAP